MYFSPAGADLSAVPTLALYMTLVGLRRGPARIVDVSMITVLILSKMHRREGGGSSPAVGSSFFWKEPSPSPRCLNAYFVAWFFFLELQLPLTVCWHGFERPWQFSGSLWQF